MAEVTSSPKITVSTNGNGKHPSAVASAISTPGTVQYEQTGGPKEMFELIGKRDHEQVVFCHDQRSGLKAIIGIHNTTLGPALGGTRMWTYASDFDALRDVLRLSRGMTYKAAAAGGGTDRSYLQMLGVW